MNDEDELRSKEVVTLLLSPPEDDRRRWAAAVIFRALETWGACRYRDGVNRLNDLSFARLACESLASVHGELLAVERPLFLRALLLLPWELILRSTGLPLRVGKVVEVLSEVAAPGELVAAVEDVVTTGPEGIKRLDLDEVLLDQRGPGTGQVVEFSAANRRKLGIAARLVEFDRLEVAVSTFRPHNWETNLRPLIPWWLSACQPAAREKSAKALVAKARRDITSAEGRYRLLGLLDWMCAHPEDAHAVAVLELGLKGSDGATRKPAAALAAALRKTEVLEELVKTDPDVGVRKRAKKLLDDIEMDALF